MDLKGVVPHLETHHLAGGVADLLDAGIAEFLDLAAGGANEVVVLPEGMGSLELGLRSIEPVAAHQVAIQQEVHGVVQGGTADPVFLGLHTAIEPFDVEVTIMRVHFGEYRETLGRFPVPVPFEVLTEYPLDVGLLVGRHHGSKGKRLGADGLPSARKKLLGRNVPPGTDPWVDRSGSLRLNGPRVQHCGHRGHV